MQTIPQCLTCFYFDTGTVCPAFPKGIPQEILNNEFDHRDIYPDDGGIRYKEDKRYMDKLDLK